MTASEEKGGKRARGRLSDSGRRMFGLAVVSLSAAHVVVLVLSWLVNAALPELGLRSLLSEEGTRWLFGHFADNVLTPLLVWLLLLTMAFSAFRQSGLPQTLRRLREWSAMSYRDRLALRGALFVVLMAVVVMSLLTVPPHAVLLNVTGGLFPGSFSVCIVPVVAVTIILASLVFAFACGRASGISAVYDVLLGGMSRYSWLLPVYLLGRQLWCIVAYVLGL